jgi:hypothetical protein
MSSTFVFNRVKQNMHQHLGSLEHAIALAAHYHLGQVDKAGRPYIEHIIAVIAAVKSPDGKIVAALHDIVEDTNMTLIDLCYAGFSERVVDAVGALTRKKGTGELYLSGYIPRVMKNALATEVKQQDLLHNIDVDRLGREPTADDLSMQDRYLRAYKMLINTEETWETK